jgi:hypothetical protein
MSPMNLSPDIPTATLELRAVEQRRRMHNTFSELRSQVKDAVREKLNVERYARQYVWPAAGTAALFSLLLGYGTAGMLKRIVR